MSGDCHLNIPPLIVCLILGSCYYIYVTAFSFYIKESYLASVAYIILLNVLFFMTMWCFFVTLFTPKAQIPEDYALTSEDFAQLHDHENPITLAHLCDMKNLEVITRTRRGHIRICRVCNIIKPDRAHHCSKCHTCILRMDHHCPWLKNCVGFTTYKFFLLTLLYGFLLCTYYVSTTVRYFILFWDYGDNLVYMPVTIGFTVAAFFGLMIGIFLVYHLGTVFRNETNIERMFEISFAERHLTFDLGPYKNFTEIFGENWTLWFIPVFTTKGNGYNFPTVRKLNPQYQFMTTPSVGSSTSFRSHFRRNRQSDVSTWTNVN